MGTSIYLSDGHHTAIYPLVITIQPAVNPPVPPLHDPSAAQLTGHDVLDVVMMLPVLVDGRAPVPPSPGLSRLQDVVLLRARVPRPRPLAGVNGLPQAGVLGEVAWGHLWAD